MMSATPLATALANSQVHAWVGFVLFPSILACSWSPEQRNFLRGRRSLSLEAHISDSFLCRLPEYGSLRFAAHMCTIAHTVRGSFATFCHGSKSYCSDPLGCSLRKCRFLQLIFRCLSSEETQRWRHRSTIVPSIKMQYPVDSCKGLESCAGRRHDHDARLANVQVLPVGFYLSTVHHINTNYYIEVLANFRWRSISPLNQDV